MGTARHGTRWAGGCPVSTLTPSPRPVEIVAPGEHPAGDKEPAVAGTARRPKIVSEMLGHTSIGITLDLYSHATPTIQREATAAFDRLLSQ